ncbi:hypothetical protein [Methylobacterium brachythecii]|uniref:Uncharacterized protein n=1 Tax=Methylobacterium brachythecii TaxID=1176177 RepID=A0A7W6AQE8_9HYPH|nr:hypothetical protein [Methylobacterium brachythecii]MBB3905325.1 hypothetical protein [Methylobacterium brachythecii]GLS45862.1 hypothetical protein GCM10007884_38530 [Methylobacterium brachythecii]
MSSNPDAFDRVRILAYSWVTKHGLDEAGLRAELSKDMAKLMHRPGFDLTEIEATTIVESVVRWTLDNFEPRRSAKGRRSRFNRQLEASLLVMMADELNGRRSIKRRRAGSVRSLARKTGLSKSKISRILKADRARRDAKALRMSLSPTARSVLEVLEASLPSRGYGIIQIQQVSAILWGDGPVARTTALMRQKRLADALKHIIAAGLDISVQLFEKIPMIAAISRGDHWKSMSDLHLDIDLARSHSKFMTIPDVVIRSRLGPVWGSKEGREVMAAYRIAFNIFEWDDLQSLFEACGFTLEIVSPLHIIDFLYHNQSRDIEVLPYKMADAARWMYVSHENARILKLYSSLLKDLSAIGRDGRANLVVERVIEVSNWQARLEMRSDPASIERFKELRAKAIKFISFEDYFEEIERTAACHKRGRRPVRGMRM